MQTPTPLLRRAIVEPHRTPETIEECALRTERGPQDLPSDIGPVPTTENDDSAIDVELPSLDTGAGSTVVIEDSWEVLHEHRQTTVVPVVHGYRMEADGDDFRMTAIRFDSPGPANPAPSGRTPAEPEIGSKLGKCVLMEVIGRGGSGTVYRAFHQSLRISVAVKVVRNREGGDEAAFRQRVFEEGRMLAQLNHPNIVRVLDIEEDPIRPWLVLELIDGITAREAIERDGQIDPLRAVGIVREVALALEAAWDVGIVHRDVKPANILIPNSGPTRLADLGLARSVVPDDEFHKRPSAMGFADGTIAYMAPERVRDNTPDCRGDIYSLGATFYELLTGHLPFTGRSWREVADNHAKAARVPVCDYVEALPSEFERVIQRMMARDPNDRYQRFSRLIHDLNALETILNRRGGGRVGERLKKFFARLLGG